MTVAKLAQQDPHRIIETSHMRDSLSFDGESLPFPEYASEGTLVLNDQPHRDSAPDTDPVQESRAHPSAEPSSSMFRMQQQQADEPLLRRRISIEKLGNPDQLVVSLQAEDVFRPACVLGSQRTEDVGRGSFAA